MTISIIRPATPECWPRIRQLINPECEFDYEQFCENIESVAEALEDRGDDWQIVDITADAFEAMMAEVGCDKTSTMQDLARGLVEISRMGLIELEAILSDAAQRVGFNPGEGPRRR